MKLVLILPSLAVSLVIYKKKVGRKRIKAFVRMRGFVVSWKHYRPVSARTYILYTNKALTLGDSVF